MFKVVNAELKKIVSKPGIYILAILLAVILVLGVFIYNPSSYSTTDNTYQNLSVVSNYERFLGSATSTNDGYKDEADNALKSAITSLSYYKINGQSYESYIKYLYSDFIDKLNQYSDYSTSRNPNLNVDKTTLELYKSRVLSAYALLYETVTTGYNYGSNGAYPIITSTSNSYEFDSLYKSSYNFLSSNVNDPAPICDQFEDEYLPSLNKCLNNLKYPTLSDNFIASYSANEDSKYSTLQLRLSNILNQIQELYEEALLDNETVNLNQNMINRMADLCNRYTNTCYNYVSLIKYELKSNAFSYTSTKEQMNLLYLSSESEYNVNSNLIKYKYLFVNDKLDTDYAHPLTIGVTSNIETNAYDYAYFILKLFSFLIIVYAVMAGCHTIAGEVKEGSMRYFAIRPVSRANILFGKFLAIMTMSIIMIIFSSIIAIAVGGAVYGFDSLTILTIFNGSTAITMHPFVMILIYILSLILEVMVYLSISMLLSCLLKSDLLSVTIMLVLYLINILLPMFAGGINSWLTYYPFSHISLYSLFGSTIYANTSNFYNILLGAKVYAGTNLGLTICVILLFIIIFNTLSAYVFKKKEL